MAEPTRSRSLPSASAARCSIPARVCTCTRSPSAPEAAGSIDITATPTQNLRWIAKAKGESVRDLTVVILDRDRHTSLIAEVRASGARVKLITDGDIFGAIATGWPDAGVDVLLGTGGTPEGVTAAAALKCMGGEIQGNYIQPFDHSWPSQKEHTKENGLID